MITMNTTIAELLSAERFEFSDALVANALSQLGEKIDVWNVETNILAYYKGEDEPMPECLRQPESLHKYAEEFNRWWLYDRQAFREYWERLYAFLTTLEKED